MSAGTEGHNCESHEKFVKEHLKPGDAIIGFNYDCVLDYALKKHGNEKWNSASGYCLPKVVGHEKWQPDKRANEKISVRYYKLHGSLHFQEEGKTVNLKERPYTKQNGNQKFTIIPPEWHKQYDEGVFSVLWKAAANEIYHAKDIIFVGYSMPLTDLHTTSLFRTSVQSKKLETLVVVNPDREARKRIRTVLQRGIKNSTRILSFDRFDHFLAMYRDTWDIKLGRRKKG